MGLEDSSLCSTIPVHSADPKEHGSKATKINYWNSTHNHFLDRGLEFGFSREAVLYALAVC